MSTKTAIQWCDDTVNPTSGCDGCELANPRDPDKATCYARIVHLQRLTKAPTLKATGYYAPSFFEVRTIPGRIAEAARRKDLRGTQREGKGWLDALPRCIFVGDLSDIFSADVSDEFLEREIFAPMETEKGARHIWLVLTKRPQRMAAFSQARPGGLPANCVAMCSVTDQRTADARVPHLLRVKARWHGVSAEPLLGPIDLRGWWPYAQGMSGIDWIILGGESGPNARRCDVVWIRHLIKQARAGRSAPFVKQLGALPWLELDLPGANQPIDGRLALKHDKGGDWNEWPDDLRVREVPEFEVGNERTEP